MKMNLFIQKSSNLFAENRLLKFFILVIGIVVLFNTFMLRTVTQNEKIVLIPPTLGSDSFVTGNNASDEYIRSITRYIMSLYLNYSSISIQGQIEDLLNLYEPRSYSVVEGKFRQFIDDVKSSRISSTFYIVKISINREKGVILVEGLRKQHMHDKEVYGEKELYEIHYKIHDSKFLIRNIKKGEV
jgi:conjugal transfer pilus assembly protein TraE